MDGDFLHAISSHFCRYVGHNDDVLPKKIEVEGVKKCFGHGNNVHCVILVLQMGVVAWYYGNCEVY